MTTEHDEADAGATSEATPAHQLGALAVGDRSTESTPVIIVGSANMDLVLPDVERIPAAGETVLAGPLQTHPGGKGANQATAVAALGTRAIFVGRVGADDFGDRVVADLQARSVDTVALTRAEAPTGVAVVLIDRSSENSIVVAPGANATLGTDSTTLAPEVSSAVVLASLEVPLDTVLAWARLAQRRGWRFVLNPAPARALPAELLPLVAVLTPNRHELAAMGVPPAELLAAGVGAVMVTLGADGAELHRAGAPVVRQSAPRVDAVDTTGAGDAFNGALAAALAAGRSDEEALAHACVAGALATRAVGARASQPSSDELEEWLARG